MLTYWCVILRYTGMGWTGPTHFTLHVLVLRLYLVSCLHSCLDTPIGGTTDGHKYNLISHLWDITAGFDQYFSLTS